MKVVGEVSGESVLGKSIKAIGSSIADRIKNANPPECLAKMSAPERLANMGVPKKIEGLTPPMR